MRNRTFRKVIVYLMIFAMLASTLAIGLSFVAF
ncbi:MULTISPECIES: stressosome-associated protein Prli42 [Jeotgalibacillus]|nr:MULTISPECIES: stressosome-associated protein Prli42 [Jeotgalibacillus]